MGVVERENIMLGIVSQDIIEETSGRIFVGLIDENRPTFLQPSFGYPSFPMEFRQPIIIAFSSGSMILENDSKTTPKQSLDLFDLIPYGPDLCITMYYYATN
jgi:hypothetical protein